MYLTMSSIDDIQFTERRQFERLNAEADLGTIYEEPLIKSPLSA